MTDDRDEVQASALPVRTEGGRDPQESPVTARGTPRVRWKRVYEPTLALEVCERIAEGETLASICKEPGMPTVGTFLYWVTQVPALSQTYRLAREISGHVLEDEGLEVARDLKTGKWGKEDAAKVRALDVALDQLRWAAGFRNPKEFSPKSPVSFQVPIQINTTLALADGEGKLPPEAEGMEVGTDVFRVEVKPKGELIEAKAEPVPEDLVKEIVSAQLEPDKRFKRKLQPRMDREEYRRARWQRITTGRGRKILRRIRTDRPTDRERWEREKAEAEAPRTVRGDAVVGRPEQARLDRVQEPGVGEAGRVSSNDPGLGGEGNGTGANAGRDGEQ